VAKADLVLISFGFRSSIYTAANQSLKKKCASVLPSCQISQKRSFRVQSLLCFSCNLPHLWTM